MPAKPSRLRTISKLSDCPVVGVAVTINPAPYLNSHAGIVYRDLDDQVWLLHLAFHHRLRNDLFSAANYVCADPEFEEEDAESVAAHCRLIASHVSTTRIKFAIHYNPQAKIAVSSRGRVFLEDESKGLNCSTFVLAVFEESVQKLIDFSTWKERKEDVPWQRHLLKMLKDDEVPESYWKKVAKDLGCKRVRPEEVAGACLEEQLPATFQQCVTNGIAALAAVTSLTGRTSRW